MAEATAPVDDVLAFARWIQANGISASGTSSRMSVYGRGEFDGKSLFYFFCRGGRCPEQGDRILYYTGPTTHSVVRDPIVGKFTKDVMFKALWRTHEAAYGKHGVTGRTIR